MNAVMLTPFIAHPPTVWTNGKPVYLSDPARQEAPSGLSYDHPNEVLIGYLLSVEKSLLT